jgi:hypothetical protein
MDSRQFALLAKQHAVHEVVEQLVKSLTAPTTSQGMATPTPADDFSSWLKAQSSIQQQRSEWFSRLAEKDQKLVAAILQECAELSVSSLFALIDGVAGEYEGVFEIVAVESPEQRTVINPENTEMLHDVFAEVCADGRQ